MDKAQILEYIRDKSPVGLVESDVAKDCVYVRISKDDIISFMKFLREDSELAFELISDVTAVDYMGKTPRFDMVYHIFSIKNRERIRVKVSVDEGQEVASVTGIWRGAEWLEREVYDMFGIPFTGHPDMRRILMPEDYKYYPLRKDFPLEGIED